MRCNFVGAFADGFDSQAGHTLKTSEAVAFSFFNAQHTLQNQFRAAKSLEQPRATSKDGRNANAKARRNLWFKLPLHFDGVRMTPQ